MHALLLLALGCTEDPAPVLGDEERYEPALSFDAPAAGATLSRGSAAVWGSYQDLEAVTANASQAALSEGGWSGEVELERGVNLLEVRGTAPGGDQLFERRAVLAGEYADPSQPVPEALVGRINAAGLDQLIDFGLGAMDIEALLGDLDAVNPILEDTVAVAGLDLVDYSITLDAVSFGAISLSADPRPGYLQIAAELPDLSVRTTIHSDIIGWDPTIGVDLEASSVQVVVDLFIGAEDGILTVAVGEATAAMDDFAYDTSLLPEWIESWLFVDTIQQTIEDMLVAQLTTLIPATVGDLLGQLELSTELDVLGSPLTLSAALSEAWVDDDGVALVTDLDVSMPGALGADSAGYLSSSGGTSPQLSTEAPLAAAVSDDLVNRLLFEVWQSGALELRLDSEDPDMGPYVGLLLELLQASSGSIGVSAAMPPVMVERGGAMNAQVGELMLTLDTPGGALGDSLTMAVALWADIGLGLSGGCLELDLGTPELALMVRESDWGASEEATTVLLEEMLPMDTLLSAVDLLLGGGFCDLLPTEGFTIDEVSVERDPGGEWSLLEIGLAFDEGRD